MPDQNTKEGGKKDNLKAIRTFQTDIRESSQKGVSPSEIVQAAERRGGLKFAEEETESPFKKYKKIIIISAAVFVIGITSGIVWLATKNKEKPNQLPLPLPIISGEVQKDITVNFNNLQVSLRNTQEALRTPIKINTLLYVSLIKQENGINELLTTEDFFKLINVQPSSELADSLTDRFMVGKFYGSHDWPFVIFKVDSYQLAFSSMIKWENSMAESLKNILLLDTKNINESFEDKEVKSHDARVLKNKDGKEVLAYVFVNPRYLVISQDTRALEEVFRRFSSTQYLNE